MMFNFFLRRLPGDSPSAPVRHAPSLAKKHLLRALAGLPLLILLSGCQTAPPLPPADLQAPGWDIYQGQALWKPRRDAEGIAGEILIATQGDARQLVQFSKNPFPIITAGAGPHSWELEVPTQGKHYSHRGSPPNRVIWFHLPGAIKGQKPPKPWSWTPADANGNWRLENLTSGESAAGYFSK